MEESTPQGLTPEVLQGLYMDQGLTESEIGGRFGLGQVAVSRLRKKWGVRTITKGERAGIGLPALTEEQAQVLVGSSLGDGHLSSTGGVSARFTEGHCLAQKEYTDWKGRTLAPFTAKFFETVKRENGKEFRSWNFVTVTCPQFRPFYDLFYPAPERRRVFPAKLPSLMTPLALAVWYMDDGNVTVRGEPRIAFGLDDVSRDRTLRALRRLGLDPVVYGEGGNQEFHFPKQAVKFRKIVEPFVIPCMAYKLPTETPRQAGDRNARGLTPEKAGLLYGAGMTIASVADACGVGTGTVVRRLDAAGVSRRNPGPDSTLLGRAEADAILGEFKPGRWVSLGADEKDIWAEEIKGVLRRVPFPAEPVKDNGETILHKLRGVPMSERDGVILPLSRIGTTFCASFFPGRYKASWNGVRPAFEAWHDDRELERAVRFQLDVGDPVFPHRVLRAVALKCRTPTVFRPTVAMFMCRRFLPAGGVWWDPCAGYGGRLLGAVAAGVRYVGTDVDQETVDGCRRLASAVGCQAEIVCRPAEDFDPPPCELVFTSPPYFNRERYSKGPGQSWIRHGSFGAWVESFLRPLVGKAREALDASGGVLALNVADAGGVPLVSETVRIAGEEKFVLAETLAMPLSAINRKNPSEPILVFRPV